MLSLRTVISKIDDVYPTTTMHKQGILAGLRAELVRIVDGTQDLYHDPRPHLLARCNAYLLNPQFTYKQISLFGLLTSRSEDIVKAVITIAKNNIIYILLEKLQSILTQSQYDQLTQLILVERYYEGAIKYLRDCSKQLHGVPITHNLLNSWLERYISQKFLLSKASKIYTATRWPFFEIVATQKIYDLDELSELMNKKPVGILSSFTYAIDRHCNVVFSRGADTSYHINLCGGQPVYGAGEVYLKKTETGIEVIEINNKSGLYLPKNEFLASLQKWLGHNGYEIRSTLLRDEGDVVIESFINDRMILR